MLNGCAYILTVDVGNTFIRFGLFAEDSAAAQECPLATCEITTPSSITADEARMRLVQVMAALAADAGMPGALVPAAAVLSCVVPALERPWKTALSRTCTGRVLTVGPGLKTGMPVHYDDPAEIGPDRIADAVAARAVYGSPCPVAISAGPITIYWYGLAYVVGALLTAVVMYRTQRRWGFNITIDDLTSVVVGVVFGLIIGARLFYVVFYGDGYYWAHPLEIFATNEGGMSFHGGLVGGIIGGVLVCRMYKLDAWTIADLAVIGAPLALCLGRCANFVNGELWGKPTDLPWGVIFGGTAGDMPRHPSQLYEAFLEGIVLFCILQVLSRKKPLLPQGTFMGVFVMGYGIVRFLIEFVRVPDAQLGYLLGGVITMGQLLSLPLVIAGLALIIFARRRNRPQRIYLDA